MDRAADTDGHPGEQEGHQQVAAGVAFTEMPLDLGRPRLDRSVDEGGELVGVGAIRLAPGSDGCSSVHSQQ